MNPKTINWLFVDDTSARHRRFVEILSEIPGADIVDHHAYTAQAAIDLLRTIQFDCIFLDHDLDETDHNHTGMVVAQFIALHQGWEQRPRHVVVHSVNIDRAIAMADLLRQAGISVSRVPFLSS